MERIAAFLLLLLLSYSLHSQTLSVEQGEKGIVIKLSNSQLLSLPLEKPFLEASEGKGKVKFKMAAFKFKDKTIRSCDQLAVKDISREGNKHMVHGRLKGKACDCDFKLTFTQTANNEVKFNIEVSDSTLNRLSLRFTSNKEEHFFGFGEQFSHLNFKGHKFSVFSEEQGIGRGDKGVTGITKLVGAAGNEYTSYAPIPFFMTTEKRGMLLRNTEHIEYDLRENDLAEVSVWSKEMSGYIWQGEPLDILEDYTAITGRMPFLPDWAYGTWLGLQGGAEKVTKIVQETKEAGNPVSAIWIQDWVGKRKTSIGSRLWWKWIPDEVNYPNFKNFCKEMNTQDVKVLGYINSFLADEGPMFEEAKEKGYLVKNKIGEDYKLAAGGFDAYLVDLTNPAAFEWLKVIIKTNLIENGLSGWMADFAEWLPPDAKLFDGSDPLTYHNQYPVDWARLNREAISEAGKEGEIVFFSRSGFTGSNAHSHLFWVGDQAVTWQKNDGFPSAVNALLSSGMSGLSLNHSDIGGYTSINFLFWKYIRSRELFYRWAEMEAFTPIFRTHEGLNPEKDFQYYNDTEGQDFFAKMGRIHQALKPYFQYLNKEASEKGCPIIRHPWLLYPKDENTWDIQYQFFVGNDLLVLPVIEEGENEVKGYFPAGKWTNIWTGEILEGSQSHTVQALMGQPATFVKLGGEWSEQLISIFSNLQ